MNQSRNISKFSTSTYDKSTDAARSRLVTLPLGTDVIVTGPLGIDSGCIAAVTLEVIETEARGALATTDAIDDVPDMVVAVPGEGVTEGIPDWLAFTIGTCGSVGMLGMPKLEVIPFEISGCMASGGTEAIDWFGGKLANDWEEIVGWVFIGGMPAIRGWTFCIGCTSWIPNPDCMLLGIGGTMPVGMVLFMEGIVFERLGIRGWGWVFTTGWGWINDWVCTNGCWCNNGATLGGSGLGGGWTKVEFGRGGIAGGVWIFNDASNDGGNTAGISNPRNFRLINLQAMENSFMSIFPSASVSAKPLK